MASPNNVSCNIDSNLSTTPPTPTFERFYGGLRFLMATIFRYLYVEERLRLRKVCKFWREYIDNPSSYVFSDIKTLECREFVYFYANDQIIINGIFCRSAKHQDLESGFIWLALRCPKLRQLSYSPSVFSKDVDWSYIGERNTLRELKLNFNPPYNLYECEKSIISLLDCCPQLSMLEISFPGHIRMGEISKNAMQRLVTHLDTLNNLTALYIHARGLNVANSVSGTVLSRLNIFYLTAFSYNTVDGRVQDYKKLKKKVKKLAPKLTWGDYNEVPCYAWFNRDHELTQTETDWLTTPDYYLSSSGEDTSSF